MQLTEVFDTNNIVWKDLDEANCECNFTVNGRQYYFSATMFDRDEDLPDRWDVEFGMVGPHTVGVHKNTNLGNSMNVFGNVVAAFKQFFQKYAPTCVTMSAADSGRQSLYLKLLHKFLPQWKVLQYDQAIIAYKG